MIYQIDAKGRQCPIPVVETKKALAGAAEGDVVETYRKLLRAIDKYFEE